MKLALGTVQFGLAYGAFDNDGALLPSDVAACLDCASGRIDTLDTARAYGVAEERLGRLSAADRFRIVTKVAPLNGAGASGVWRSLDESLNALATGKVQAVLLHRAQDLLGEDGEQVWAALEEAKRQGRTRQIGASVYSPHEALRLIDRYPMDIIQAPFSVFDQRLRTSGALAVLKAHGVEVHVRSVFLQGFALAKPEALPNHLACFAPNLARFRRTARELGSSPLRLALLAAQQETSIDRIVVGVQSTEHLAAVLDAAASPLAEQDLDGFASHDMGLIDPSRWSAAA